MKVLMLGWEFPPHISGGLGTACFGLVGGLRHHGVDVVFVVPHVFGDEDESAARLLGTNGWEIEPPQAAPRAARGSQAGGTPRRAAQHAIGTDGDRRTRAAAGDGDPDGDRSDGDRIDDGEQEPTLQVLGVDSALAPYLGPQQYSQRVRELEPLGPATGLAADESASASNARRGAQSPPASTAELPASGDPGPPIEHADAEPPAPEPAGPISLGVQGKTGRYSRDLFAEVGRYTMVVADIARREGHQVVHAHDWMTFPAGVAASRASGKPLIIHVHSCEYDRSGEGANPRIVEIEQAGMDAADRVVCVSHYTASVVASRYRIDERKIRVVHNAVTQREQQLEWHQERAIDEPVVLFLGRVTFQKGPDYFLQAASLVVKEEPSVRFVLGGSGDMLPRMIETAAQLGLARHVFFTGFLRGDDVERMYAMADLYVMPSVSEPFGIAPLEAMALDVPVIVSRQSGVAEVLQHALKVDFWDVRDMAEKILAVLRRPALRKTLVESGREEVARMSWDLRGQHLRDLYGELVS
ncbi:MAG TPA: glycosyltransferase family 4 protein [Thermoanaerobaculia bacterium]|nr:glycosyltransferase family 4 protein [Thermoanaerobaculia bacterium]